MGLNKMALIFVVDDDPSILKLISEYLRKDGYTVNEFSNGDSIIEQVALARPDCLILDIMMPGIDGLTLLTQLRMMTEIPIIMISARGEEIDRIIGLELGCNDFLRKPFNPRELTGRVKANLRLVNLGKQSVSLVQSEEIVAGNVAVSEMFRQVTVGGSVIYLTSREYELLSFFVQHLGRPYNRDQLVQQVWKYDFLGDVRVVDDLVKRLRKKLTEHLATLTIETIWGFGYKAAVKSE
jgi:DNA-binding response OmpR family regulator